VCILLKGKKIEIVLSTIFISEDLPLKERLYATKRVECLFHDKILAITKISPYLFSQIVVLDQRTSSLFM
jgi:hypothetical protein